MRSGRRSSCNHRGIVIVLIAAGLLLQCLGEPATGKANEDEAKEEETIDGAVSWLDDDVVRSPGRRRLAVEVEEEEEKKIKEDASADADANANTNANSEEETSDIAPAQLMSEDDKEMEAITEELKSGRRFMEDRRLREKTVQRVRVLADEKQYPPAVSLMGEWYLYGKMVRERNETRGVEYLKRAAKEGEPVAQAELGFLYSTGLLQGLNLDKIEADTGKALLYWFFASRAREPMSLMASGFRHKNGLDTPKSCQTALMYYNPVAEAVVRSATGPGTIPPIEKIRLRSEYMESSLATGREREEDMIKYYLNSADMGNPDAANAIGQLLTWGAKGLPQDYEKAFHYFKLAAEQGNAEAVAQLGHMYANGLGVEPSNETAIDLFEQAMKEKNPLAFYGMGYMYQSGFGVEQKFSTAFDLFKKAAELGSADAQFHLGAMYIAGLGVKRDYRKAFTHFNLAGYQGSVLALYNLAMMHIKGLGVQYDCQTAVTLLKTVAEKGIEWGSIVEEAYTLFKRKMYLPAVLLYIKAAEMGYEVAQANSAHILSKYAKQLIKQAGIKDEPSRSKSLEFLQKLALR